MASQESRLLISIDARNAERTARELSRELQNITNGGNQADRQVNQLGSSLRSLAGYMAGIVTVGAAINRIDAYTGLQNRLKLVTGSQVELNAAMNDTFSIAQRTASSWDSVAMVYQRFADNADRLNISMQQTASLTETVSKAISVSGGSAASAEAALMQFGQALASGVLRGEEFNSIAEQAPALLKAIAFGLDTNVGSLRAMAAAGEITGDVLVDALSKAQPYIDELFSKTDFTIAQEFTRLSNEVTKFVGEAGKGTGAASALGGAIGFLSENLSTIADIAIVGGVALLTKTILAQTVAVYGSITASALRRKDMLADLANQAASSAAEVRRTAALAQYTAMQLADAKATAARMTGLQRLAYIQATVIPLEAKATQAMAAHTATTAADTVVQNANNAARSRGAMLLGAVGGWVGVLTIGVTALAAGYMYLKNQTAEANAKLEEQSKVALETDESLKKLSGNDKISAVNDLSAAFDDQNKKLAESKASVDAVLFAIRAASVENEKARKVTEDAKNGVISYDEAIKRLNNMDIPTDLYDMLKKQVIQYDINADKAGKSKHALGLLGETVELVGNLFQNAAVQVAGNTEELNANETAAQKAAKAQEALTKSLADRKYEAEFTERALALGMSEEKIKATLEAANFARKQGVKVTDDMFKASLAVSSIEEKNKATVEAKNKAISDGNKAQKDAAKEAERERKQALKDAEALAKQQGEDRVSIAYSYLDELQKMEEDFQREIESIRKANFGAEQKQFEDRAKARYDFEHEMYLIQITEEINLFKWSDSEKLDHWKRTQLEIIESSGKYNDEIKQLKLKALNEEYALEKAFIELARQQREFQAREQFMSETDRINERYRLEQGEILKNNNTKERTFLLEMNRLKKQTEEQDRLNKARIAVANRQDEASGIGQYIAIETNRNEALAESEELLQAELARNLENREALYEAHYKRIDEIEARANLARYQLNLSYGEQITGSLADSFKTMRGEQSKGYKILFAASKAFAIAQAGIAIFQGIAQAAANPFPYNLVAMATVAASTASLVSNIRAIKDVGFQSGGYTGGGGVSEVAGVVHGQEYVLNANATKRVGRDTLDAINSGGDLKSTSPVNIIINPPSGYEAVTKKDGDNVTIDIVEKMIDSSWDSLGNPNSKQSRAMQSAFALQPDRNN